MKYLVKGRVNRLKDKLNVLEKNQIIKNILAGSLLILFYFAIIHFDSLWSMLLTILSLIMPFIIGYGISFILRPLEHAIAFNLRFKKAKTNQTVAVFLSILIGLLVLALILLFIIPDLISSIINVSEQLPNLIRALQSFYEQFEFSEEVTSFIQNSITTAQQFLMNSLQSIITQLLSGAMDFTNLVVNFFLSITIAIYIGLNRSYFSVNAKRLSLALFGKMITKQLQGFCVISSEVFKQFFYSRGVSTLLLGMISVILLTLFNVNHALLIATFFGLFNLIPFFGMLFAMVTVIVFLMLVQIDAVINTVIILVLLKMVDHLFLSKKLYPQPVNLPTFWSLLALTIGVTFYGVLGLFISVPLFTILYVSIRNWMNQRKEMSEAYES